METLVPRQHLAPVRGSYIRRFTLLPHSHRVDAKRECDAVYKTKSKGKPLAVGELSAVSP